MTSIVPIENSGQVGVLVASAIAIFIVVLFVGLRLIAKRIGSRLDYSDYCIIAALVRCMRDEVWLSTANTIFRHGTQRYIHVACSSLPMAASVFTRLRFMHGSVQIQRLSSSRYSTASPLDSNNSNWSIGHHVVRPTLECHGLLQQTLGPVHVHNADTKPFINALGSGDWIICHPVEHWQYRRRLPHLSTSGKELGFCTTWFLWKPAKLLLLHGCHQHRHRHIFDRSADALPLSASPGVAQKASFDGSAQHRSYVRLVHFCRNDVLTLYQDLGHYHIPSNPTPLIRLLRHDLQWRFGYHSVWPRACRRDCACLHTTSASTLQDQKIRQRHIPVLRQ